MKEDSYLMENNNQAIENWFKGKTWNANINLEADTSVNAIEFFIQYHNNKNIWDKVFAFVKEQDLAALAVGKYIIDEDNAFAMISEYSTKDIDDCIWESHKKYIDLQYIIKGKESMGVTSIDKSTVIDPYSDTNDVIFYTAEDGDYHIASPNIFFLFFPQDAHRPCIKIDGFDTVKKLVVKIKKVN